MNSFIPWIGGKMKLRKVILSHFPEDKPERYIEPFGGAGWVLFSKDRHAKMEVYNDGDKQLVNLFRCAKYHAEELIKEVDSLCLNSRELFFDFKQQLEIRGLTDIQRAARFYLQIRMSFGADRRSFGCSSKNILDKTQYLRAVQERLKNVVIENKDFEDIIRQYDRKHALFYLDPPYHGTEDFYDGVFEKADHLRLNRILCKIKGKFILSYNDDEYIRNLYKKFNVTEAERQNNISSKGGNYKELIIKNY
ncbi:MAG: Modification methylase DpnIIA [Firmicutes bacterium ADurb.Bin193]|nr:MAG: Modification methylase DpnIIA [Firmicutes bacterium ADurb.Bin193]